MFKTKERHHLTDICKATSGGPMENGPWGHRVNLEMILHMFG